MPSVVAVAAAQGFSAGRFARGRGREWEWESGIGITAIASDTEAAAAGAAATAAITTGATVVVAVAAVAAAQGFSAGRFASALARGRDRESGTPDGQSGFLHLCAPAAGRKCKAPKSTADDA